MVLFELMTSKRRAHTEDQVKQVEFLRESYRNDFKEQAKQYDDLNKKITFLFGFSVSALTLYASYAKNVNSPLKVLTLLGFVVTIYYLCVAFANRDYNKPARLDTEVNNSTYYDKVYQEVVNIKLTCESNDTPLNDLAKYVGISILAFSITIVLLAFSFII